jgi:predicted nuclease of predicted toxin-antitoxin system
MKIKIDENLPIEVAEWLNQADHNAKTVYDQALSGHPDKELIKCCKKENRILITLDTDFTDIRAYPPGHYVGIIVI